MKNLQKPSILKIGLALFMIFTSSNFLLFTWESAIGYYSLTILASFFGGALIVDFERSLKLISIAYIASCIVLVLLYPLPVILYGESYAGEIDSIVAVTATTLSRTVIISFPISIFACLSGCFSGRSLWGSE